MEEIIVILVALILGVFSVVFLNRYHLRKQLKIIVVIFIVGSVLNRIILSLFRDFFEDKFYYSKNLYGHGDSIFIGFYFLLLITFSINVFIQLKKKVN